MMKKTYLTPVMAAVTLHAASRLLAGSKTLNAVNQDAETDGNNDYTDPLSRVSDGFDFSE